LTTCCRRSTAQQCGYLDGYPLRLLPRIGRNYRRCRIVLCALEPACFLKQASGMTQSVRILARCSLEAARHSMTAASQFCCQVSMSWSDRSPTKVKSHVCCQHSNAQQLLMVSSARGLLASPAASRRWAGLPRLWTHHAIFCSSGRGHRLEWHRAQASANLVAEHV